MKFNRFNRILVALQHVQSVFPAVNRVDFDKDGNWLYTDGGFSSTFEGEDKVDISILEKVAYDFHELKLPCFFVLRGNELMMNNTLLTIAQTDKLRISIAESLGWEWHALYSLTIALSYTDKTPYRKSGFKCLYHPDEPASIFHCYESQAALENVPIVKDCAEKLPKYHESRDACEEFEKTITEWDDYELQLHRLWNEHGTGGLNRWLACAPPIYRAVAYANMKRLDILSK